MTRTLNRKWRRTYTEGFNRALSSATPTPLTGLWGIELSLSVIILRLWNDWIGKCLLTILTLNCFERFGNGNRKWKFVFTCSRPPHNCESSHFTSRKGSEWLQMRKNEKCRCKACKTDIFRCQMCRFSMFSNLKFDKEITNAPSALLSYISTREFLRTREKCALLECS